MNETFCCNSLDSEMGVINAFNNTSRYLDDILNMNNDFCDRTVHEIYPKELTLTKSSLEPTHATFLDLDIHLFKGRCVTKIYDKRDEFDLDTIDFTQYDGDIPKRPAYGVYTSQLIIYARACPKVEDFNTRNLLLSNRLLRQRFRYHQIPKMCYKCLHKNKILFNKYNSYAKTLIKAGITEPES